MTTKTNTYTTPVTEALKNHVSIRKYNGQRIPDEMLTEILNAARRSPTSSNMQAYTFVVVRNQETKEQIAEHVTNQEHIRTCDVFVAICADVHRLEIAAEMHGEKLHKNLENFLVSSVDAAIAGMSLATAAESFGLGTVMIGGMRNNPAKAAEILNFPQGVYVVYGLCIGFPDEEDIPSQKPRLPEDLIIHYEGYDNSDPTEQLKEHDSELAEHYRAQGRNLNDAAWTGVMASKFGKPKRENMKQTLEDMGFVID